MKYLKILYSGEWQCWLVNIYWIKEELGMMESNSYLGYFYMLQTQMEKVLIYYHA
jgi:hypothetical protein